MKNKPLQFCVKHSSYLLFFFFFSLLVFVRGIALEHRGRREMESDILIRGSTVSRCGPAPCPRPICSLGPLEANHSPVSRAPQPNGLDAVCAALLIIQFVAKQLPIWHIWCSSHLVCLNWTMRKRRMRSGRRSGFILRDAVIFSHLLYRLLFQCRGEIVLTAYKKEKKKKGSTVLQEAGCF